MRGSSCSCCTWLHKISLREAHPLPGIDKGNHDVFAKNRRWSARNCRRDIFPLIGGEIIGSAVRPGGGASVFSNIVRYPQG